MGKGKGIQKETLLNGLKWGGALLGLILMVAWTGGMFHAKVEAGKVKVDRGIPIPEEAKTYTVMTKDVAPKIDIVGTAASEEKVHLSARMGAYVKEVLVSAGDVVKENQVLIKLDDRELRKQLAGAEAQLNHAKSEYKRTRKLYEKQATTEQSLTATESMYNSAKAQVDGIKVMLTYSRIISPINGVVTDRKVEVGDLANPGQLLLSVYDPENMQMVVPVPMRLIEKLTLEQEVEIELDRPTRPFSGQVKEIVSEIDPRSRTQVAKIHINDPKGEVLPGTFGRIWVEDESHPAILIPNSSVYNIGQLKMVQVVLQKRVLRRMVKTGPPYGDKIEILSGLKDGDIVLLKPVKEG